jgi:hypothetical protein
LKTLEVGHNGLPYANEWRFFYFKEKLLSVGFYWSLSDCVGQASLAPAALQVAKEIARIAARFTTFYTMDLAETEVGDWMLIELNDGQMAVPSENDPDELYRNLRAAL